MATGEENPFEPVTDTRIEADEPLGITRADCERARLKSALDWLAGESPPPKHPQSARVMNTAVKESGEQRARGTGLCALKANPF
jgi:hypothetical protein